MLNGTQVLDSIDQTLARAQQEAAVVDREIAHLTERLIQLREEKSSTYRALARLRLDSFASAGLIDKLASADDRARGLLARRQTALEQAGARIGELSAEISKLTGQRATVQRMLESRRQAVKTAEDAVRSALAETDEYRRQRSVAEKAAQIARFAAQKTSVAEKDRQVKGKPYEDDPLFMYLWQRHFGTSEYRANPIDRFFDSRVASLCGFDKARSNYFMLMEIPRRLADYAGRMKAEADGELQRLREIEEIALQRGESGSLRRELQAAEDDLDALEEKIETMERKIAAESEQKNALIRGDDELTRQAVAAIEATLVHEDLRSLREAALGTPFEEDDVAVRKLEAIDAEFARIEAALASQKVLQDTQAKRLAEIDAVRREYRNRNYRNDTWDFRSGDMLGVLLGELLRGAADREVFRETMRQRQRQSGSDGLGWGGGSSEWPDGGGGGSGVGSDGFGGGDFRTGGSF